MQPLALPNDRIGPSSLQIAIDKLPPMTRGGQKLVPTIERKSSAQTGNYTLSELVHLPNEELDNYLRSVEDRCARGENIDTDLWLIRRAQEVLLRMDGQYEIWMKDKRTEMYALLEQLKHVRARVHDQISHVDYVDEIDRYTAKAYDELTELDRRQEENGQRVQALIRCEGFCYRNYTKPWPLRDAHI